MVTSATSSNTTSYLGLSAATPSSADEAVQIGKAGQAQSRQSLISSFLGGGSTSGANAAGGTDFTQLLYDSAFLNAVSTANGSVTVNGGKKIQTFATPEAAVAAGKAIQTASQSSLLSSTVDNTSADAMTNLILAAYGNEATAATSSSSEEPLNELPSGALYSSNGVVSADTAEAGSAFTYEA